MYTLAIIGGGPAGYTAAERALHNGLSVVLFEKKTLGGTCLNEGCIPTKALLYGAKQYHNVLLANKYGVSAENASFDFAKMQQRKTKVVRKLVAGVKAKLNNPAMTFVNGEAEITACTPNAITITCQGETYEAQKLLLCTGSDNAVPPIPGIDQPCVWDSTAALATTEVPKRLAVVGGGVIGLEFAALFATLGSEVTVIEMLPEILGNMDTEISAMLRETMTKEGVHFYMQARVTSIDNNTVHFEHEGENKQVEADHILVSVGRRPHLSELEKLGLQMAGRGIAVNEFMQTSLPNVYAAGDITGFSMLAHTAVREAEVAVAHLCGQTDSMSYKAIPGVVYTNPEVAGVGATEQALTQKGIAYQIAKLPMAYSGRFVAENEGVNGLCKILYQPDNGQILGVHMLGNAASEIINMATLALEQNLTIDQWRKSVVGHPTVSEILKETMWTIHN